MRTGARTKTGKYERTDSKKIHQLFENQLKDIYWAEKELAIFIPKLVRQISSRELISTLEKHAKSTEKQVNRLEEAFRILGSSPEAEECPAMAGLIQESVTIVDESEEGPVRDAFIIGAVQKVEHYEMATYGTLKTIATMIGEFEIATLFGETLKEEKEADMKLTEVAENVVNIEASLESGELEDIEGDDVEDLIDEEEELHGMSSRGKSRSKSRNY